MRSVWLLLVLGSTAAFARSAGLAASGCQGCHSATSHQTTIDLTPPTVTPGATITVTVTARGPGLNGGFFLSATRGAFTLVSGQGTRLLNGDVVQATAKGTQGGAVSFQVQWTAPSGAGAAELSTWTVLGNGDQRSGGDSTGEARRQLVFGCSGTTSFRDFDGDGVGSASASGTTIDCAVPQGFSTRDGDCDDFDATVVPGGVERCNGKDDDCDGQRDEGLSNVSTWPDADGDGFGDRRGAMMTGCSSSGRAPNDQDCDDREAMVRPGAMELCNQRDDNCDGRVDEGVRVRCGTGWCAALGLTCDPSSCMPGRPLTERCNLLDDDCDGQVDEGPLCPSGQACVRGSCQVTDVDVTPMEPAPSDAGLPDAGPSMRPAVEPAPSCSAAPVASGLVSLLALRRVRRRRAVR
jgi:hypothetical protein